jgi:phosphatidylglycerophosphatase A
MFSSRRGVTKLRPAAPCSALMNVSNHLPGNTANPVGGPAAPAWATVTATLFGVGRLHPGPGTWGSLATTLIWGFLAHWMPASWRPAAAIALAAIVVLIGIPAATRVARSSGIKDPQFVVIDEVAGQLITLIGVPLTWKSLLLGFILFRVFDILKPPPVRQLERIPDGAGIVLDDVGAGLYALAVMHLLRHFGILMK